MASWTSRTACSWRYWADSVTKSWSLRRTRPDRSRTTIGSTDWISSHAASGSLVASRVRASAEWIEVRNLLGATRYAWSDVRGLSFPDGSAWARLELPADEYISIMAVQAADGPRAVTAMRSLRALYKEAGVYTQATTQHKA